MTGPGSDLPHPSHNGPDIGYGCFACPPNSPELNPDDFTTRIITALERLTRLPTLLRAFFGDPNLRYITA